MSTTDSVEKMASLLNSLAIISMMEVVNDMGIKIASKDELYLHRHKETDEDKTKKISYNDLIDLPAAGGDMLKATYDTDDNGIVDNAEKLEGSTKAQVQDHTPKSHGNEAHTSTFITGAQVPANETDPNVDATLKGINLTTVQDHTPKAHTLASHSTKAHSELTGVGFGDHHIHSLRTIFPASQAIPPTSTVACTTNYITLMRINVPVKCTIDAIIIRWGSTCTGNIMVALYPDNGGTPAGGAPLASSGSVAKTGTSRVQVISFTTPVQVEAGKYWVAFITDENTTLIYYGLGSQVTADIDWRGCYANIGSFAIPNPCPAVTWTNSCVWIGAQVSSVP
jgi:hypothetical protein